MLRRRFGQLLHDFAVSQCVCSYGAEKQVIRLGSCAAAQVVYVVINTGLADRKGLTRGPEASDGSYCSTAADQYSIATGHVGRSDDSYVPDERFACTFRGP